MRRALSTIVVALSISVGVLPATPASAAPRVRYYAGPTSEGGSVHFKLVVTHGVPHLALLLLAGPYACGDGTQGEIEGDGVGWGRTTGPVIEDGRLELSENWGALAFDASGRLGIRGGSGTLTFLWAGLTADEQAAQLCTVGEVTWSVERTSGEDFWPARTLDVGGAGGEVVRIGKLTSTRLPSTNLAEADGPLRRYRGRTSQDLAIAAHTSRVDTGIRMSLLDISFLLACDDGTAFEGGIWPTSFFDAPLVLPPGRLDLDLAPIGFARGFALHVHGELDAHAGSGAFTMVSASLTDELQPQLCRSGDQTWRLWRTDEGF
ncbi:MAG TPA: hypothetical protein VFK59_10760 [Actinomycetota bacterium]|nr:hypothetical protein [Actinomycetota bacterium]